MPLQAQGTILRISSLILRQSGTIWRGSSVCAMMSSTMRQASPMRQAGTKTAPRAAAKRTRIAELLDALVVDEGTFPTSVPGVELTRRSQPAPRRPVVYRPMILFLGQGRKCGYLGNEVLHYDAHHYLALSVPVPAECEIVASAAEPLLAVTVAVEPAMLAEILINLDAPMQSNGAVPRGIYASPLTTDLEDVVVRLLQCLRSPLDSRILGRQIVREIVYRVLQDESSGALRALATRNDQFMRIERVLQQIHSDYAQPLSIEELARRAGMSVSSFHHNFKAVTASSPLQYLKSIRLHRARLLMIHAGHNASTAAGAVGYESASQFGREFKRFFGSSPGEEAASIRGRLAAGGMEARDRWVP
jgi:AraC-like DNA-binding protein